MRQTFAAFAELVSNATEQAEVAKSLNEDAPLTQPDDLAKDAPPVDKNDDGVKTADEGEEKAASYVADYVMSSIHAQEEIHNLVKDCRFNPANGCILLIIHEAEEEKIRDLCEFVQKLDLVENLLCVKAETANECQIVLKIKPKTGFKVGDTVK